MDGVECAVSRMINSPLNVPQLALMRKYYMVNALNLCQHLRRSRGEEHRTVLNISMRFKLKNGLDIPITGAPDQVIDTGADVSRVSVLGADYPGLKPVLAVEEGNRVALGQTLFTDKNHPEISYTSPASGVVSRIGRGYRRVLEGVEIKIGGDDELRFSSYSPEELDKLSAVQVRELLQRSGLWTALRTRPFSRVPPANGRVRSAVQRPLRCSSSRTWAALSLSSSSGE